LIESLDQETLHVFQKIEKVVKEEKLRIVSVKGRHEIVTTNLTEFKHASNMFELDELSVAEEGPGLTKSLRNHLMMDPETP